LTDVSPPNLVDYEVSATTIGPGRKLEQPTAIDVGSWRRRVGRSSTGGKSPMPRAVVSSRLNSSEFLRDKMRVIHDSFLLEGPARRCEASDMKEGLRESASGGLAPLAADDHRAGVGFVALSRFVIANGMSTEVKSAFRDRPHLVDHAPGYIRMEVISPFDCPEEIWLLTFWTDEASFRSWHHSHRYRDSHRGIPQGLKLVPGETKMRHFEHVSS
jgi:heme-degrading monooxygenase HmoA